jgi:hypothetical protein
MEAAGKEEAGSRQPCLCMCEMMMKAEILRKKEKITRG